MIIVVRIKGEFRRLEPAQDAGGWPPVFRPAAERHHGLHSSVEILQIRTFLLLLFCEIFDRPFTSMQNLLKQCHCASASYLFQQDKFYDVNLDIGDKSVQCSRKVDCVKLWLMWKAVGTLGLAERVDRAFLHVKYVTASKYCLTRYY